MDNERAGYITFTKIHCASSDGNQLAQAEEHAFQNARILKRNEQRYLQLMDFSPVAFFTLTEGRIIYCNTKAAELFGYETAGTLIGEKFH